MGKAILTMHMSLDGIVTDEHQWMTLSDEILEEYVDYYHQIDRIVIGGNTYSQLAEYWQTAEQSSDSELERLVAKQINDIPKIVVSRSPRDLIWRNSEQILITDSDSFSQEMTTLKNKAGTLSVESGLKMWQLYIQHALFDELWLFVNPVLASQGERPFDASEKLQGLRLTSNKTYRNGVLGLYYQKEV